MEKYIFTTCFCKNGFCAWKVGKSPNKPKTTKKQSIKLPKAYLTDIDNIIYPQWRI